MDIRFVSSLTAEEEELVTPILLRLLSAVLDGAPFAYTIRVETTGNAVFHQNHPGLTTGREPEAPVSLLHRLAHKMSVH